MRADGRNRTEYYKDYWNRTKRKPETVASNMASTIRQRTGNPKGKNSSYTGVECRIGSTHREVKAFILEHFRSDIDRLLMRGITPSIDRIRSEGHYEPGNLRIISVEDNVLLGSQKGGEIMAKPIKAIDPEGNIQVFPSVIEAHRTLGVNRQTIQKMLGGGQPNRGKAVGWVFEWC